MTIALIPLWAPTTIAALAGLGVGLLIIPAAQRLIRRPPQTEEDANRVTAAVVPPVVAPPMPAPEIEENRRLQQQLQDQERKLSRAVDELERARSEVETETEAHTQTRARLSAEMERKDLAIREHRDNCEQQRSLAEEYRDRLASFQDREAVCAALRADQDRLPASLQEFAGALLDLDGMTRDPEASRLLTLPENIDCLDRYVYRSLPAPGMVIEEPGHNLEPDDLLRLVAMQGVLHEQLHQIGLQPIQPTSGDLYEAERHTCRDEDLVYINDEPQRHNRVASVKRIGYEYGDQVIRKAEVRLFMFLGRKAVPVEAASVEPIPSVSDARTEDPPRLKAEPASVATQEAPSIAPSGAQQEAPSIVRSAQISKSSTAEQPAPAEQPVGRISAASLLTSEPPPPTLSGQREDREDA